MTCGIPSHPTAAEIYGICGYEVLKPSVLISGVSRDAGDLSPKELRALYDPLPLKTTESFSVLNTAENVSRIRLLQQMCDLARSREPARQKRDYSVCFITPGALPGQEQSDETRKNCECFMLRRFPGKTGVIFWLSIPRADFFSPARFKELSRVVVGFQPEPAIFLDVDHEFIELRGLEPEADMPQGTSLKRKREDADGEGHRVARPKAISPLRLQPRPSSPVPPDD